MGEITDEPSPTVVQSNQSHFVEREAKFDGYAIGNEWEKLRPGESSNKYLNLAKASPDQPSPTICQMGGQSPGVATVTHPTEKRKFTIAELKRICGFPDDFVLTGSYSQQWERLGRAVPPPMMAAVARVIREEVLSRCAD